MEPLTRALHAASADPPPTSINLDRLIDGRRRSVLQHRMVMVTGVAVVAAVAIAVPLVFVGRPGSSGLSAGALPCPTMSPSPSLDPASPPADASPPVDHSPSPGGSSGSGTSPAPGASVPGTPDVPDASKEAIPDPSGPIVDTSPTISVVAPTEDCGAAAARLDAALLKELHKVLPGVALPRSSVRFQLLADGSFQAAVRVTPGDGDPAFYLEVTLRSDQYSARVGDCAVMKSECVKEPDGTLVFTQTSAGTSRALDALPSRVGQGLIAVRIIKRDGTTVYLNLALGFAGTPSRLSDVPPSPLSADQLRTIGEQKAMTLYP